MSSAIRVTHGDLDNSMAPLTAGCSNDDVGVDPVAAKRYKFTTRCKLILIKE